MTDTDRALDAWMAVIAESGWAGATLDRVARTSGLPPAAVAAAAPDPWTAIDRAANRADLAAIATVQPDDVAPVRDRLFDLIMARFDALGGSREAHASLLRDAWTRPGLVLVAAVLTGRAAARLLSAAGLGTVDAAGLARINALAAILADVGRVWLTDHEPDLSLTMRRLDQRLGLAERWAEKLRWGGGDQSTPILEPAEV